MSAQNINASYANNRNNGIVAAKAPSVVFAPGYFVTYDGLGTVLPYSASETLFFTPTGTFVLGETVSQATSAATGVVIAVAANGITVKSITGTFDTSHVVTGGTSSATGTPSSILVNSKILGLSNDSVTSASSNFAASSDLNISTPVNILDVLDIPVSAGTATAALVGTYVNVDPANPGQVDVSAAGTQILVTRVISATVIKGIIALKVA
jgi:hypothetical protein